jgi:hypothetical protein
MVATVPVDGGPDKVRPRLDQPCKNVDLQTNAQWAMSQSRNGYTAPASGYTALSTITDVPITAGLQNELVPSAASGQGLGKTGGWFFSLPPSGTPFQNQMMMAEQRRPFGQVINLNPACFGEVYWVGGVIGQTYMAFAVWLPYQKWADGTLPVIVHFRPYYNDTAYGEAIRGAAKQNVPSVLATDGTGRQVFLDAAWYYLLGLMGFVPQLLAARRLGAIVFPVPPRPDTVTPSDQGNTLFPKTFANSLRSALADVVAVAVDAAGKTEAGKVPVTTDRLIFTANSRGGKYLNAVLPSVKPAADEVWIFDGNNMDQSPKGSTASRLYIAQSGTYRNLLSQPAGTQNVRLPWELEAEGLSVVDMSAIPDQPGMDRHNMCGRVCFSHAAALSPLLATLRQSSQLNRTLGPNEADCWPDRLEFWVTR